MNEFQSRLYRCTGRFFYKPTDAGQAYSWADLPIYYVDNRTGQTIRLVPGDFPCSVVGGGEPFFGWPLALALVLVNNGYIMQTGYSSGGQPIDNVIGAAGRSFGAKRIRLLPGNSIQWWLSDQITASNPQYLKYALPAKLDDVIASDGTVTSPAALAMILMAMLRLKGRTVSDLSIREGADAPWFGFQNREGRPTLLRSAWTNNDASHLTWLPAVSTTTAQTFVSLLNVAFPGEKDNGANPSAAHGFSCYGGASRFIHQVDMLDASSITQGVAGSSQFTARFLFTRFAGSCNIAYTNEIWASAVFDPELYPLADGLGQVTRGDVDAIASGVLAVQETLATVQGGVSDVATNVGGVSTQVSDLSSDVESAKQAVLGAIGAIDVDLSPIEEQLNRVFSQSSVDAQIIAAMAIKIAIGKLPKKLRVTLLNALRDMRYDQGALPDYAGQYGGAINLYDMLFDSNGKPTFTQEAPNGSDTQH